jgi:hypothetical protein
VSQSVGSWCLLVPLALALPRARVEGQAAPGAPAVGVVRAERQQRSVHSKAKKISKSEGLSADNSRFAQRAWTAGDVP